MKYILFALSFIALPLWSFAAEYNFICQVEVRNGSTGETKTYVAGHGPVEFQIADTPGWKKCRMSQIKRFQIGREEAARVDIWCFDTKGNAINNSAVTTQSDPATFTILELLSSPISFSPVEDEVNTRAHSTITTSCVLSSYRP